MWGARRCLGALAALLLAASGAAMAPEGYVFSGACDHMDYLNGLLFEFEGHTASGAPYYKADAGEHGDQYIYYDPDCADAGGDPEGRWIVDEDQPSTTRLHDLDGDKRCRYHARINSEDLSEPPAMAEWYMKCESPGQEWDLRFVTLSPITTTTSTTSSITTTTSTITWTTSTTVSTTTTSSTSLTTTSTTETSTSSTYTTVTTTTSTTTSTSATTTTTTTISSTSTTMTSTSTTASSTTTTTLSSTTSTSTTTYTETTSTLTSTTTTTTTKTETSTTSTSTTTTTTAVLHLTGACSAKAFLNGLAFQQMGPTASGAPYYKAIRAEQYLYYDADCDENGKSGRWVIDALEPNVSRIRDLDMDGMCKYHARLVTADSEQPPLDGVWHVWCGSQGWEDIKLTLGMAQSSTTAPNTLPEGQVAKVLRVSGACESQASVSATYMFQGETASGAPYYKADNESLYIYYDPACSGHADAASRWIVDSEAPNLTVASDLDQDGACHYNARVDSHDTTRPPTYATWRMACGPNRDEWEEVSLHLEPMAEPNTTTAGPGQSIISGAKRSGAGAQTLTLLLVVPLLAARRR